MKILFAGWHNPNFKSITEYCENALIKLGHNLSKFEYRQYLIPGRIRNRISALQNFDIARINNKLLKTAETFKPDMVFVLQGVNILPETIDKIKRIHGIPCVNWFIDYPLGFETAAEFGKHYDHVFVITSNSTKRLHQIGIKNAKTLYLGCDQQEHKNVNLTKNEIDIYKKDIVFVGSWYPEREKVISELEGFDIGLWGPGWNKYTSNPFINKILLGGQVDPAVWVKIFNAAKIVLNINYGFNRLPDIDCNPGSTKLFEIMACGAFQIVDRKNEILDLFTDTKQLATYTDINDLKTKLKYYLEHKEERIHIAAAGQKEVLAKHTYEHRMKEMLSIVFPDKN